MKNETIDYKKYVLDKFPDAFICKCAAYGIHVFFGHNSTYISESSESEEQAWEKAHNYILNNKTNQHEHSNKL